MNLYLKAKPQRAKLLKALRRRIRRIDIAKIHHCEPNVKFFQFIFLTTQLKKIVFICFLSNFLHNFKIGLSNLDGLQIKRNQLVMSFGK